MSLPPFGQFPYRDDQFRGEIRRLVASALATFREPSSFASKLPEYHSDEPTEQIWGQQAEVIQYARGRGGVCVDAGESAMEKSRRSFDANLEAV